MLVVSVSIFVNIHLGHVYLGASLRSRLTPFTTVTNEEFFKLLDLIEEEVTLAPFLAAPGLTRDDFSVHLLHQ